jgi:methionyl-tRNA formyltransferase
MDEGIDTGPILLQRDCSIGPTETAGEVEDRLAEMGASLLLATLEEISTGRSRPQPQTIDRETYAPKIRPETAWIPWTREADFINNLVRAMNPRPGAITTIGGERLKIWRARMGSPRSDVEQSAFPGTVLAGEHGPRVACGQTGTVILLEMQRGGRRRVSGEEAARGRWFCPGDRLGEGTELGGDGAGRSASGV